MDTHSRSCGGWPGGETNVQIIKHKPGASAEILPGVVRRYVGKTVSDFPETVDLSSPETAWSAWHRASGAKDAKALSELSWAKLDPQEIERSWQRGDPEDLRVYNEAVLGSKLIEVLTYRGELAETISYLPFPPGKRRQPYSARGFGKIGGQWKSLGEDRCASLEDARDTLNRKKDRLWDNFQRIARDHPSTPTAGD